MKLNYNVNITLDDIERMKTGYKATKNFTVLQEFINSKKDIAMIENDEYKNIESAYISMYKSIKTFKLTEVVGIIKRGDQVYIYRVPTKEP